MDLPTALIIGNGAIGAAVGAELGRLGVRPRFIGRQGPIAFKAKVEGAATPQLDCPAPSAAEIGAAAIVFVAVRAFDLEAAFAWTSQLGEGVPVVPLANGATWDIVKKAAQRRPELRWRLGFCTLGVSVLGDQSYAIRSKTGGVAFGPLQPGSEPVAVERQLVDGNGLFRWHTAIAHLARRKWLYNTVINSLTATRRLPKNGDLLGDLSLLSSVFAEALQLSHELWGPLPMTKEELFQGLQQLLEATESNENSMARDVRLGRPTESAFLAGLAVDKQRYPLLTTLHRTLSGVN